MEATPQPTRYVRGPDVINVAKGNNTYQILYRGGSYNALIGAANTKIDGEVKTICGSQHEVSV